MDEPRPDLIIGIDFGMTCTGIAYNNTALGGDSIRWIQRWPGRMQANENKVPTVLVYPTNARQPSSWGFLAESLTEQQAVGKDSREWFKTLLDEDKLRQAQAGVRDPGIAASSIEEVEQWYTDYFSLLYSHVELRLQNELLQGWSNAVVEYHFSVPTTWKPHPTVQRFRKVVERAGFGFHPRHRVYIGLTEAEAAAVHMAKEAPALFKAGDVLLVCDVGGGTTDLSALKVMSVSDGPLNLAQLDVVFGATLGSAQIDRAFEILVLDRLTSANAVTALNVNLEDTAWEIMKSSEYQNAKCDYGAPDATPRFSVAIPGLARTYRCESVGIIDGELRIAREELQTLFDTQITKLFELIDRQISSLQQKSPHERIAHLVLSGGLGNSSYVQQRIRARYTQTNSRFPNTYGMQVRISPDPQLVVCKGLVADRVQKLRSGRSILGQRCCRASYGTRCKILYDPSNPAHLTQQSVVDPLDGKTYLAGQIDWFIRKGEPVSIDSPVIQDYIRKVPLDAVSRVFPTPIITSDVDREYLPRHIQKGDNRTRTLCTVSSDLTPLNTAEFKLKNRHWWQKGKKYLRMEYTVKMVLGPADINFELWCHGRKLSQDTHIRVEWEDHEPKVHEIDSGPRHRLYASNQPYASYSY